MGSYAKFTLSRLVSACELVGGFTSPLCAMIGFDFQCVYVAFLIFGSAAGAQIFGLVPEVWAVRLGDKG